MAPKKPAKKKPTKKQNFDAPREMMRAVQSYVAGDGGPNRNVSVEDLIALAEERLDSEAARKSFEALVSRMKPGTVGAAKLVTAADALEDEDLLLDLARKGFLEALRSHTMRHRIVEEARDAVEDVANRQAAVGWSSPDDRFPDAWTIAEFADAIAVNGAILNDDDKIPDRPENYVLTNHGGRVPAAEEVVHPASIASAVRMALGVETPGSERMIDEILDEVSPNGIPVSVSGETEVWMDPRGTEEGAGDFDLSVVEDDR